MLLAALRAVAQGSVRVYLTGDSTCATKSLDNQNPERGWGQMFQPLFSVQVTVENHASNGRSTKSFRDEGRWDAVCGKLQPGDYVFIQFGHNDQKATDSTRYASPEVYAENLRRYVRQTREKDAIPLLLTPIVRRHFEEGALVDSHGEYPAAVRRVAAEEGVALIDMERLTRDWVSSLGDVASRDYYMWVEPGANPLHPAGLQDNTHLNVRGARAVARMIAGQLREYVPELGRWIVDHDFVVAKDGSGDFFTLTEAVAAIPDFCRDTTRLLICEGIYSEKISIAATKRNVVLEGRGEVVVTWSDYASKTGATGHAMGTSGSATIYFGGDNWQVSGLTFENAAGRVGQAVAVQCLATDLTFTDCRFLGDQDTLYLYGVGNRDGETVTRNSCMTFTDCYIEGTTDFIFGSAAALFRNCEIHSKSNSYITAASTCRGQKTGFIFDRCRLTAAPGVTKCYLGRPWRDYAQTVFVGCLMDAHILPQGWHDWDKPHARKTVFYAEYGSSGPGANAAARVEWAHRLPEKTARRLIEEFGK